MKTSSLSNPIFMKFSDFSSHITWDYNNLILEITILYVSISTHYQAWIIFPFFSRKIVSACFARSFEWVTIITHLFISWAHSFKMEIISAAVSSSKFPVGSSVNCTPTPLCLENRDFNGMYICVLCTTIKVGTQADCPSTDFYSNLNI